MTYSETHALAVEACLSVHSLSLEQAQDALNGALSPAVDFADLYCQRTSSEHWCLEEGIVKSAGYSVDSGFGLRVVSGAQTGFSYSNDVSLLALRHAAQQCQAMSITGQAQMRVMQNNLTGVSFYQPVNPILTWTDQEKVQMLQLIDRYTRSLDARVKSVNLRLSAEEDVVLIMNDNGHVVSDVRPMVGFHVQVVLVGDEGQEQGFAGGGGRGAYGAILDEADMKRIAESAVRKASINLSARPAPAGDLPVVLAAGWPGVLLHEAVGHGLEADANRKGSSVFSGLLGEEVASSLCSIVDDATIKGRRGSLSVDDEGTPGQKTLLVENGRLVSYMYDKQNAMLMSAESTGNGRRESYAHLPMPRMTNTYMLPGDDTQADMIASIVDGIYAVDFSGGQVDTTSGQFVFTSSEAYRIEQGKITYPVKKATLSGHGPEVLRKISMVGSDCQLDPGIGVCGKAGQSVPVGVGQPALKVDSLLIGGSQL